LQFQKLCLRGASSTGKMVEQVCKFWRNLLWRGLTFCHCECSILVFMGSVLTLFYYASDVDIYIYIYILSYLLYCPVHMRLQHMLHIIGLRVNLVLVMTQRKLQEWFKCQNGVNWGKLILLIDKFL
jgi:hypothetical protein